MSEVPLLEFDHRVAGLDSGRGGSTIRICIRIVWATLHPSLVEKELQFKTFWR